MSITTKYVIDCDACGARYTETIYGAAQITGANLRFDAEKKGWIFTDSRCDLCPECAEEVAEDAES